MGKLFTGIYPAFYACYDDEGNISPKRTKALCAFLYESGVAGLYVNGSSGECIYLSPEERKTVLESAAEEVKGKLKIICHVACNNTRDSCLLAAHAEKTGVDAIAAIPPIYFHLPENAVAAYWNAIAQSAPRTPFVIYNIPQLAGTALTDTLLERMLENKNVTGVKNSSLSVQDILKFKDLGGKDFTVFNGPDEQYAAGRMMGADAGIGGTYAVMPHLFVELDNLIKEEDFSSASLLQQDITRLIYALCAGKGNMYAINKKILEKKYGLHLGGVRAPLMNMQPGDEDVVENCCRMLDETYRKWGMTE